MKTKKHLGQHFLTDQNIAQKIVESLTFKKEDKINCIEVGPGKGVLTQYLLQKKEYNLTAVEYDIEAVEYLKQNIPASENHVVQIDFLKYDIAENFEYPVVLIGNLPYNISAPIFFKLIDDKDIVEQAVFMIQKEVAERIASIHGSKKYGILSVLLQSYFDIEYLFTVSEHVFDPPPKIKSAVIRLTRKKEDYEIGDYKEFKKMVKSIFGQRRKMIRNTLKPNYEMDNINKISPEILNKRPEQLSVVELIELSNNLRN